MPVRCGKRLAPAPALALIATLAARPAAAACPAAEPSPAVPAPAAPPPITKPVSFSVLEDYEKGEDLAEVARDFELMRELGVRTWRGGFGWDDYEPERGRYDFEWLHRFARLAERYGIALRPYIGYTAPWAAKGGSDDQYWNDPPRDIEDWYRFVRALAGALSVHPNVLSYEIYNEQNARLWWDGSAGEYAAVLRRAADAIREADPDAQVIVGGLVWPDGEWLGELCGTHGAAASFDIAAFHAYVETWFPPERTVENFLGEGYRDGYLSELRGACGERPVWINELGYPTTPGRSEEEQANWWARAIATFLAEPAVEHIGIYEIKDLPRDRPVIGDAENRYLGITRSDRTKKLAFHTLDRLTDLLDVGTLTVADGGASVSVVGGRAGSLQHHLFRRPDGRQVLFLWDRGGSPTVEVVLGARGSAAVEYALDGTASPHALEGGARLEGIRLEGGRVRIFEVRP